MHAGKQLSLMDGEYGINCFQLDDDLVFRQNIDSVSTIKSDIFEWFKSPHNAPP